MKYCSTDRLQDFAFHDSALSRILWDDNRFIISVKHLKVRRDAAPNKMNTDVEIDEARITFYGLQINEFEQDRGKDGQIDTDEPSVIYKGRKACSMFENEFSHTIVVTKMTADNGVYELRAIGVGPYFSVRFSFFSVDVEWEDERSPVWYELYKRHHKTLTIATPAGDISTGVTIVCHEENVYYYGVGEEERPSVSVGINYGGADIWGYGKDYLWVDAFADLQKKLPVGVNIKCCLTCRYGNMCPAGNWPGEIFCTKEVEITQKSDLFFYTVDDAEREKRIHECTDICDKYCKQSDEYYTYNDYLHDLK